MAKIASQVSTLALSANDVRSMTGWPQPMVDEWLNRLDALDRIITSLDQNNETQNSFLQSQSVVNRALKDAKLDDKNSWLASLAAMRRGESKNSYLITADHQTAGNECVKIGATLTLTLNGIPKDGETVRAYLSGEYTLTVSGNTKQLSGASQQSFSRPYETYTFVYKADDDEWIVSSSYQKQAQVIQIIDNHNVGLLSDAKGGIKYVIDGFVNVGNIETQATTAGLSICGVDPFNSSLFSNESDHTFITSGATSGPLFVADLSFFGNGTNSTFIDWTGAQINSTVAWDTLTLYNFTQMGELNTPLNCGFNDTAWLFCEDGLTFTGPIARGVGVFTFLVFDFGVSGTVWKAGTGLKFFSRFVSKPSRIQLPAGTSSVADFAPSNFASDNFFNLNDSLITRNGVEDPEDPNYFPNIDETSDKSLWKSGTGIFDTSEGFLWRIASASDEATTTIAADNTPVKAAGTTTYETLEHFSDGGDNAATCDDESTKKYECVCGGQIEGNNGAIVEVIIRQWDDSASAYIDLASGEFLVINAAGGTDVATFQVRYRSAKLRENDRPEIWLSRVSGGGNFILKSGSYFSGTVV